MQHDPRLGYRNVTFRSPVSKKRGNSVRADQLRNATHCRNNHEYTPENTGFRKKGNHTVRQCLTCVEERTR